jgi:hypothetical protein
MPPQSDGTMRPLLFFCLSLLCCSHSACGAAEAVQPQRQRHVLDPIAAAELLIQQAARGAAGEPLLPRQEGSSSAPLDPESQADALAADPISKGGHVQVTHRADQPLLCPLTVSITDLAPWAAPSSSEVDAACRALEELAAETFPIGFRCQPWDRGARIIGLLR